MHQVSRTLGLIWPDLLRDRIFIAGLILKLFFILLFVPEVQQEWFVSFMVQTFEQPSVYPWSSYLDSGGNLLSFPYGPIMFLAHLPSTFIGWLIDSSTGLNYFSGFGFRVSLLMADILILVTLLQQFEDRWRGLLIHYWLSPLVIFITYWHGQTDLIPVAILVLSIALLKNKKILRSGLVFAGAVAAKHSMVIVLPFIAMYLWFKRGIVTNAYKFVVFFLLALLVIEGPFLFSDGFQQMVVNNREVGKIFWLFIPMGDTLRIYIVPLVYLLLLYSTWRLRRMNFDLLLATLGVAFCVVILLTPPSPGWFLWISPMLAIHFSKGNIGSVTLGALFGFIFVGYHLIYSSGSDIVFMHNIIMPIFLSDFLSQPQVQSLLNTLIVAMVTLITLQMFRDGIKGSDYYCLGKKPLVIGISGGLGVGKTTFSSALAKLFGNEQVLKITEGDYYNWNPSSPIWKMVTPLNPRSSSLSKMVYDLRNMLESGLFKGHFYDAKNKKFRYKTKQRPRQVIILDSAFALYTKQLVEMEDVRFFLDMDDNLRMNSKEGDVRIDELNTQGLDFKEYIQPQKTEADVTYKLLPINQEIKTLEVSDSRVKLKVRVKDGLYCQELIRVLIGVCGLQVNTNQLANEMNGVEIDIQGDVDAEDIKFASKIITPRLNEFIDDENGFFGGKLGLMQLIALTEIDHALKRRKI